MIYIYTFKNIFTLPKFLPIILKTKGRGEKPSVPKWGKGKESFIYGSLPGSPAKEEKKERRKNEKQRRERERRKRKEREMRER